MDTLQVLGLINKTINCLLISRIFGHHNRFAWCMMIHRSIINVKVNIIMVQILSIELSSNSLFEVVLGTPSRF